MSDAAGRLCASCGMCCDGVLFYSARLGPEDSPRSLAARGLRIKRHADGPHLLQPCAAHTGTACRIYADRPERCRRFVCRQLLALEAGRITESSAAERIAQAREKTTRVHALLAAAGDTRSHKSLAARCAHLLTPPHDAATDAIREELVAAQKDLEDFLRREFHVEHAVV